MEEKTLNIQLLLKYAPYGNCVEENCICQVKKKKKKKNFSLLFMTHID